jgi:hypothetical protein
MSGARCCCDRGSYTLASYCACSDIPPPAGDPYVQGYDPAMGCVYFEDAGGLRCWYCGPESPTKETLDGGDYDLGTPTFTEVEDPDLACCLCCECGASNADPVACFDTPEGGCVCCPEEGDGSEWIITFDTHQESWGGSPLRKGTVAHAYGTIHYKNSGTLVCDRVLSIDVTRQITEWDEFGALVCTLTESITDCGDIGNTAVMLDTDTWGKFPCGERLMPQYFIIPCDNCAGVCGTQRMTPLTAAPWDADNFSGTDGCIWFGKSFDYGGYTLSTSGAIIFSGDCHQSRVEWNYTTTRTVGGTVTARHITSGFFEVQLVKPPCAGGCGQRARYFGHGAIAPADGNGVPTMTLVPRSLMGVLA